MTVLDWPLGLAPKACAFDLLHKTSVYSDSRSGISLRQTRSNPRWQVQYDFGNLAPVKWKALSALRARLHGSVESILLYDFSDQYALASAGSLFSDGTCFSDGTAFADGQFTVAYSASVGATLIRLTSIHLFSQQVFQAGDKIELPHNRLYLVTQDAVTNASGLARVHVSPPLIEVIIEGDAVITFRPRERFYLINDAEPITRDVTRVGNVTLNFAQEVRA